MKLISIFFLTFVLFSEAFAQSAYTVSTVPNPRTGYGGFVSDPDKNLTNTELQELNEKLLQLEKDSSAEFAIVILNSIGESTPKDFAVELFNKWGIGKKGKDNGLLLLLVMDQRRWEFETGYGLEGVLPDAILKRIGEDRLVPKLRQKKMSEGFMDVVAEITRNIKNEPSTVSPTPTEPIEPTQTEKGYDSTSPIMYFFLYTSVFFSNFAAPFYALALFFVIRYLKNRPGKKSGLLFSEYLINWKVAAIGALPYIIYYLLLRFVLDYIYLPPTLISIYVFLASFSIISLIAFFLEISKKDYKDPYEFYKVLDTRFRSGEFITISILFLPLFIFVIIGTFFKKRQLRLQVRVCPKCNIDMVRLDETKDDFFLKDGQKIEEKIGSIDYDVWFCEKSKDVKIYAYESLFTSYSKCPSCKFKTYFVASDTVTVSPTCTSSGSGIRHYACKHCSYKTSSTYTIPARDCSKSSSSSSGSSYSSGSSSSSSSSFGGGRSGGGGAGGSW